MNSHDKNNQKLIKIIVVTLIIVFLNAGLIILLNTLKFENDSYSQKIITMIQLSFSLITTIGISVAIFQLIEQRKQGYTQLEIVKKSKSIELMKDFALYIDDISFIESLFSNDDKYHTLLSKNVNTKNDLTFRLDELKYIFPDKKDQSILLNKMTDILNNNFTYAAQTYLLNYCDSKSEQESILRFGDFNWDSKKYKKAVEDSFQDDNEKEKKNRIISQEISQMSYLRIKITRLIKTKIYNIMNSLEHFSSNFNCGLADEEMVYQSIHQIYIKVVTYFYPFICNSNCDEIADHYYANIIHLYNLWIKRYHDSVQSERNKKNELLEKTKTKKTL